ncbi:hypothetical protein [Roseateles sp.]|uniref:hypothetical protein n=1 Tax=Roseateles sp. TaxID=1971397 RepID=UPI0031D4D640
MSSPSLLCFRSPATSTLPEADHPPPSPERSQTSIDPVRDAPSSRRSGLPRPSGRPLTPAQLIRRFGNEACRIAYRLAHPHKNEQGLSAVSAKTPARPESEVTKGRREYVEDLLAIARRQLPRLPSNCPLGRALAKVHAECIGKRPRPPVDPASPYGDLDALASRLRAFCAAEQRMLGARQAVAEARAMAQAGPANDPFQSFRKQRLLPLVDSCAKELKRADAALNKEHLAQVDQVLLAVHGGLTNFQQNCQLQRIPDAPRVAPEWRPSADQAGTLAPSASPLKRLRDLSNQEVCGHQRDNLLKQHDATELRIWVARQQLDALGASTRPENVKRAAAIEQRLTALYARSDALMVEALKLLNGKTPSIRDTPPPIRDTPPPIPPRRRAPLARAETGEI